MFFAVQRHLVVGVGLHVAVTDQKTHRLASASLQQGGWIKALQGCPEAIAATEISFAASIKVDRVGYEAATGPRKFAGPIEGWHPGNRKEATAGDVVHQIAPEAAGWID